MFYNLSAVLTVPNEATSHSLDKFSQNLLHMSRQAVKGKRPIRTYIQRLHRNGKDLAFRNVQTFLNE